jgi:hypothetical protein
MTRHAGLRMRMAVLLCGVALGCGAGQGLSPSGGGENQLAPGPWVI